MIEGDDWGGIAQKVLECDVLVIGSPTYYYDICGQLKNFIDRTYSLYHDHKLAGRKGIVVAVNASTGADRTAKTIEGFLNAHEFSSLGTVIGKGTDEGDVMQRRRCCRACREEPGTGSSVCSAPTMTKRNPSVPVSVPGLSFA